MNAGLCIRIVLCAVFATALITLNSVAQVANTATVLGTVTDSAGAAVQAASVSLRNGDNGLVLETHTDDAGQFRFLTVPAGRYELTAEKAGFLAKNFPIRESMNVQFQFEAFNVFNHPSWGTPDLFIDSGTFSTITNATSPRILQFSLALKF